MKNFTRSILLLLLILLISDIVRAQAPTANFTATPLTGCAPFVVHFTNTSTGNPTSYNWDLGNSTVSVLQHPSTTYTVPGTYTVKLTVSNGNGSDVEIKTAYITVYAKPTVSFTANDTEGCPPHSVIFSNTSTPVVPGPATYSWSFGDGNVSTTQSPSNIYTNSGYYNVTLIVTNSTGCNQTLTKQNYIHVFNKPDADFTANPAVSCIAPSTVSFTSTVTGTAPYSYQWTFGDASGGNGPNPTHTYANSGTYTVTLTVTDGNGCKDTMSKAAYIDVGTLNASFTYQAACEDTTTTFTSTAAGASAITWDFGDGGTASGTNPSHLYTTPGIYNVKQVVFNSTCKDSVIIPVTVHAKPNVNFTISPNPPCPGPVSIQYVNQTTGGSTYFWIVNGSGTSTAVSPTFVRPSGFDTVTLVATSAFGCSDTIQKIHSISNLVLIPTATPNQGCAPLLVSFNSDTLSNIPVTPAQYPFPISSWHWDFGDGHTASGHIPPPHLYTNPGTYIVTHTVTTVFGCVKTDTCQVHVGVPPIAGFTASPTVVCASQGVTFVNTSTNATYYSWDFGDNVHSIVPSLTHVYNLSGIFSVTLHAYNNGCEDSLRLDSLITVHPPTAMGAYEFDCDTPLLVRFYDTASIGATTLTWYFGDNTSSTVSNPVHIYPSLGTWPVTLITFNNVSGCSDTLSDTIRLIDPVANFVTPDTAICPGDSITFTASFNDVGTG